MHTFRRRNKSSARAGFTLVELVVVVGIVGVLATMAIPMLNQYVTQTRNKRSIADIRSIDKAITAYMIEKNAPPANLNEVNMGGQTDPWGRLYIYRNHVQGDAPLEGSSGDKLNEHSNYDLCSGGIDGVCSDNFVVPDSKDDIVRYEDGTMVGERP